MEMFVEVVGAFKKNINWFEDGILKIAKEETKFGPTIDLSEKEMGAFLPKNDSESRDPAELQNLKKRVLTSLEENMEKKTKMLSQAKAKNDVLKNSIVALKFALPAALSFATVFIPVVGGAIVTSAVAWEIKKVLDVTKGIQTSIDILTSSDYKSAMVLFKDLLISLTNDIYPKLADVKTVYVKAVDGYQKLDDTKVEEKLELIKIQMFCIVYENCYDEKNDRIIAFTNVPENHRNVIREKLTEKLKDIQNISEQNLIEYYSETSLKAGNKIKYQKMLDSIDHIKKTTYCHVVIKDRIHQEKEFAVKVWSLKSYMVPEGEEDQLHSSMNEMRTHNNKTITIQASIFQDKKKSWFLKIHLSSLSDYEGVSVICKFKKEGHEPSTFLPYRMNDTMWKIDTNFLTKVFNQNGIMSFYILKKGTVTESLLRDYDENEDYLPFYELDQLDLLQQGFTTSRQFLEAESHSVATNISFMNLTRSSIKIFPPAMSSGYPSEEISWPESIEPLSLVNMITRKANYSLRGSVGATLLKLDEALHLIFFWDTPYDQNLYENTFGFGYYSGETMTTDELLNNINNFHTEQQSLNFHLHKAGDGPVSIILQKKWSVSVHMTSTHKADLEVILSNI